MFFVINKEKIFSFVIAVGMVGILLGMTNSKFGEENTVEASSVYIQNEIVNNEETRKMENKETVANEIKNVISMLNEINATSLINELTVVN